MGWQLDGHHINLHCFVLGDQMVFTPAFLGAEPCHIKSGELAGLRVFEGEERNGLAMVRSLEISDGQRRLLTDLVETYIGGIRDGHAALKMRDIATHLDETHFTWMGGTDDVSPFYYKVQSPVVLIEFDHEPGVVFANEEPTRHHVHTIVRTPNGNDYGIDLLRQHYERHH